MSEAMYDLLFIIGVLCDIIFSISVCAFVINHIIWMKKIFKKDRSSYQQY